MLLTEKQIEEMAKEFSETNYDHPELKSCSEHSYINGVKDLLNSASDCFGGYSNTPRIWTEGRMEVAREAWQACELSHAKKAQEKDAEIARLTREIEKLQKENQKMREALRESIK